MSASSSSSLGNATIIFGSITIDEILKALQMVYPSRSINIVQDELTSENGTPQYDVVLKKIDYTCKSPETLSAELIEKQKETILMKQAHEKAMASIVSLNKQQKALYDEFVLLRQKYDQQKSSLINVLWTQCCTYHPDLRQIPHQVPDDDTFIESEEQVGKYFVKEALGEGQFAMVKSCVCAGSDTEYALKIILKERITSFSSLMRVSTEIDNLKHLKNSEYIIKITDIIQSPSKLYIITEKGGFDLFEFFDAHPDGVPDHWAKQIICCILKATMYCHDQGICHRDLKPENILVTFDPVTEKCVNLKLCDFGLSTKFNPRVMLTDFCGSPGFFAPEMIIHGTYFGDKADVWSIGCILLELILGHEKFCDVWMASYDYEILQNKTSFTRSIEDTLRQLPRALHFTPQLNEFILKLLQLQSTKRPVIRGIATHPWLEGMMDEELAALRAAKLGTLSHSADGPFSPLRCSSPNDSMQHNQDFKLLTKSFSRNISMSNSPSANVVNGQEIDPRVDTEVLKRAFQNLSEKERKQMEEYILRHRLVDSQDHNAKHLPPIEPPTPNIGHARKLINGNDLTRQSRQFSASISQQQPGGFSGFDFNSPGQPPTPMKATGAHLLSPLLPRTLNPSTSRGHLPGLLEYQGGSSSTHLNEFSTHSITSLHDDVLGELNGGASTTRSLHSNESTASDVGSKMSPLVSSLSHSSIKIT